MSENVPTQPHPPCTCDTSCHLLAPLSHLPGDQFTAQRNRTQARLYPLTIHPHVLTSLLHAAAYCLSCRSDLPGLIDMLVSTIWSFFFLGAGASLLSWGGCKSNSLCLSWNGTIGVCFFLWVLYTITAVVAGLDLRAQIQALKGVPPGVPARKSLRDVFWRGKLSLACATASKLNCELLASECVLVSRCLYMLPTRRL
jgi:hypothetical protein